MMESFLKSYQDSDPRKFPMVQPKMLDFKLFIIVTLGIALWLKYILKLFWTVRVQP